MSTPALVCLPEDDSMHGGYVFEAGKSTRFVRTVEVDTEFAGEDGLHSAFIARLTPTRIAEGLTAWRWGDRVGYGWSEYLDHV